MGAGNSAAVAGFRSSRLRPPMACADASTITLVYIRIREISRFR
ncbi:hypothetical protein HD593_002782 [Nonomuraea rubra]|uniref:Uncharacterized protein n=1 Tax=Nonomuraea rubra TaxID=46180 RepID=A0A7X0NR33_9ACTN|nr:hypothetical protein [Nonomuraea rubra]